MVKSTLQKEAGFLARYGIIGVSNNLLLYGVFLALFQSGVGAVYAAGGCYILGVTLSYALNRRWTFESQSGHRQDLPRFLTAYGLGLLFSLALIAVLLRWVPAEIAQVLNIVFTAIFIYCTLRLLRFGKASRPQD